MAALSVDAVGQYDVRRAIDARLARDVSALRRPLCRFQEELTDPNREHDRRAVLAQYRYAAGRPVVRARGTLRAGLDACSRDTAPWCTRAGDGGARSGPGEWLAAQRNHRRRAGGRIRKTPHLGARDAAQVELEAAQAEGRREASAVAIQERPHLRRDGRPVEHAVRCRRTVVLPQPENQLVERRRPGRERVEQGSDHGRLDAVPPELEAHAPQAGPRRAHEPGEQVHVQVGDVRCVLGAPPRLPGDHRDAAQRREPHGPRREHAGARAQQRVRPAVHVVARRRGAVGADLERDEPVRDPGLRQPVVSARPFFLLHPPLQPRGRAQSQGPTA